MSAVRVVRLFGEGGSVSSEGGSVSDNCGWTNICNCGV